MGLLERVAQRSIGIDLVVVAAADPGSCYVALAHEIGDDCLGCTLGDPDPGGDVSASDPGVAGDAHEHVAVVGEERPARPRRVLRLLVRMRHMPNGSWLRETAVGFPVWAG